MHLSYRFFRQVQEGLIQVTHRLDCTQFNSHNILIKVKDFVSLHCNHEIFLSDGLSVHFHQLGAQKAASYITNTIKMCQPGLKNVKADRLEIWSLTSCMRRWALAVKRILLFTCCAWKFVISCLILIFKKGAKERLKRQVKLLIGA